MDVIDLLDSQPIELRLNRTKAELVLKAIGRLDGDDLAKVEDLTEDLRRGLAPPDMSDPMVRSRFEHELFRAALHDLLGKIPGRWVVWRDGKVASDHATKKEAFDAFYAHLDDPGHIYRIEPLLGVCFPGGYFIMDEFKKYEADWKHGWSYEQSSAAKDRMVWGEELEPFVEGG